jgi:hypothetical protein
MTNQCPGSKQTPIETIQAVDATTAAPPVCPECLQPVKLLKSGRVAVHKALAPQGGYPVLRGDWGQERGWIDLTSDASCDKCGRDNHVEAAIYSHPTCPLMLCQEDAAEWERGQQPEDEAPADNGSEGEQAPDEAPSGIDVAIRLAERAALQTALRKVPADDLKARLLRLVEITTMPRTLTEIKNLIVDAELPLPAVAG